MKQDLSGRELQVLEMAAVGFTDSGISNKLGISLATVGTYWGRVRVKYGQMSRTELVARHLQARTDVMVAEMKEQQARLHEKLVELGVEKDELETTVATLEALVAGIPDAVVIVDREGDIQKVNSQACLLFGHPDEKLTGMNLRDLVPERFHGVHKEHRLEYFEHGGRKNMGHHLATPAVHADGTEFAIAATLNVVDTPGGRLALCAMREMPEDALRRLRGS